MSDVDSLVTDIHRGLGATPNITTRDVVLVTGPWLAGASSLVAALRAAMPDRQFVERDELALGEAPAAVVFVASAISPLTGSDCALLDAATANTDLVVCAVSKTDLHRNWREVLAADRDAVSGHAARYASVPWVGVAVPPDGPAQLDDLTAELSERLDEPGLPRRNRLRQWENRLNEAVHRTAGEVAGVGRVARVTALQDERGAALRDGRTARTERTIALRSQVQQAKVELTYFARNRCNSVRGELQEDSASMTARRVPAFEEYVAKRVDEVMGEVYDGVTAHLSGMSADLGLTAPPPGPRPQAPRPTAPVLRSRRLENWLMMLLGAGFGLGVALTVSRLFADLDPRWTIVGLVAGGVLGLAVTLWVVGARGVLQDRAVLERWVGDVAGELRAAAEQHVAARMVTAESALTAQRAEIDESQAATVTDRVAVIDAELREHAMATARATAVRNRELPTLRRALDAVRAELGEAN